MRHGSRHAVRLTALTMVAVLLGTAGAAAGNGPDPEGTATGAGTNKGTSTTVPLQILSFNDYHGHLEPPGGTDATLSPTLDPSATPVGGSEYLATTLNQLRANAESSLTVTAGDLIGGSPFLSGLFHDEPSVESLEAMGLDISGVGNHEFDEGVTELLRMQDGGCHPVDGCYFEDAPYDGADFPWLAANVFHEGTNETVLPGTWVERVNGVYVGFIGMTLEDTPVLVAQAGIEGIEFRDEVQSARKAVRELRRWGVRSIVVLVHEGGIQTGTYQECAEASGPIVEIAQKLDPEIDLVVSGHTHQPYVCNIPDPKGNPRMVTSASSFGRVVTETWLTIDKRTGDVVRDQVTSQNHLVARTVEPDPALTAVIAKWKEKSAPVANRAVGNVTELIARSPNRDTESSLANLIADAQLAATAAPELGGAQIAFMNPGGVRADLAYEPDPNIPTDVPGSVTYGEAFAVQPFGNLLVTMDLTGAQVQAVLEQQAIDGRPGGRNILILGVSNGLTFDYDASKPFGERVSNEVLNGTPIDPAATYRITVNSFLADGGDAFTVFAEGTNRLGGGDDLAAFVSYLTANDPTSPPPTDRINEVVPAPTP